MWYLNPWNGKGECVRDINVSLSLTIKTTNRSWRSTEKNTRWFLHQNRGPSREIAVSKQTSQHCTVYPLELGACWTRVCSPVQDSYHLSRTVSKEPSPRPPEGHVGPWLLAVRVIPEPLLCSQSDKFKWMVLIFLYSSKILLFCFYFRSQSLLGLY